MKVFDRETYLKNMDCIHPESSEERHAYNWPYVCDGLPVEQCVALGYVISDDWLKDTGTYMIKATFSQHLEAINDRYLGTDGLFHELTAPPLLLNEAQATVIASAFSQEFMKLSIEEIQI